MAAKEKKLERPVQRALVRLIVALVLVSCVVFVYVMSQIYETKEKLSYRNNDLDNDAIPDYKDNDMDQDGTLNIDDKDADDDGMDNWEDAALAAEALDGMKADYLNGRFNNLGVRMGMARGGTVPLLAYERAGVYLAYEIRQDAALYPSDYQHVMRGGKVDVHDPRALHKYAQRQNWLVRPWVGARIGDLIFFEDYQVAIVVDISGASNEYTVVWADPDTQVVRECPLSNVEAQGFDALDYVSLGD